MATKKPWGGRFSEGTDRVVEAFTSSIETDKEIALDDVEGSIAHAKMLGKAGLISNEDSKRLTEALAAVRGELEAGTFRWDPALEDVHMNVEGRGGQIAGDDVAGRLHTARSRNDQVALDERLYLRRKLGAICGQLADLERALVAQAKNHVDTLMPGYTHLQRAQPIRLAHHLLAYREMFSRDRERASDAAKRAARSPLGAGALAGTPHPIDRAHVAASLGFESIEPNSLDAVSSRDGLLEAMSAASISMIHLSRFCEDLVLWCTQEFGYCTISDAFTTGSSMMPQKKNPDIAELVRGKSGRVVGSLVSLLMTVKGLPLAYNRDLQEDKPALFDALNTWERSVEVMARMVFAIEFHPERMRAALDGGFVTATELADYLVTEGVPFREAHEVVGKVVRKCVDEGRSLTDLALEELVKFHPSFGEDVRTWLDVEHAVERRDLPGGPAKKRVQAAIRQAELELSQLAD